MFCFIYCCIFSSSNQHKKHKKKSKKRKQCTSDDVSVYRCNQLTDLISPSADADTSLSALSNHAATVRKSETFVGDQSELLHKKSHKRKRKHYQDDVIHPPKHCKYQKVECDDVTSSEISFHEEHHKKCRPKHSSNEKLPQQLFSDAIPDEQSAVNGGKQKKHKKKKKKRKLYASESDGHGTPYSADCEQLQKHKKKKSHKKTKGKDNVPQIDLAKDLPKHSSAHLSVSSANVVCGNIDNVSGDAEMNTSEASQSLLVNKLDSVSPADMKYVERVYNEHKSSKSKHRRRKVNTDIETEVADNCIKAADNASPDVCSQTSNHSARKKSDSEQFMDAAQVLELLRSENSLYYLHSRSAIQKAGENF